MNTLDLTGSYLRQLQEHGIHRLALDEGARQILRSWMLAAKRGQRAAPARGEREAGAAAEAAQPVAARPAAQGGAAPLPAAAQGAQPAPLQEGAAPQPAQAAAIDMLHSPADSAPPPRRRDFEEEDIPFFRPAGNNAEELWEAMRRMLPTWEPLRRLGTLREKAVFGMGRRDADIMLVGDAPNYADEKAGLPFQGDAGGKLDGMLKAMGLSREDVYLTHILKFRPAQARQTIATRPPTEKEIRFCAPVLDFEIRMLQPRVIVALGVIAARGVLRRGELPLSAYQAEHGRYGDIPVVVTHHPSYLLRSSDLSERRRLWEEMLGVMECAGLPISEKQRGYFLPKRK